MTSNVSGPICADFLLVAETSYALVPPFGQEENEKLQSIFELSHLRPSALFLDTQCQLFYPCFIALLLNFL